MSESQLFDTPAPVVSVEYMTWVEATGGFRWTEAGKAPLTERRHRVVVRIDGSTLDSGVLRDGDNPRAIAVTLAGRLGVDVDEIDRVAA